MHVVCRVIEHSGAVHTQGLLSEVGSSLCVHCRRCGSRIPLGRVRCLSLIDDMAYQPGIEDAEAWIKEDHARIPRATYDRICSYTSHFESLAVIYDASGVADRPSAHNPGAGD